MDKETVRTMLEAAGQEIYDDDGNLIGMVYSPAKFKVNQSYLGLGGFLIVSRSEETGRYHAAEYDALPHPKTGNPYPGGHALPDAWVVDTLEEALAQVLTYFPHLEQGV